MFIKRIAEPLFPPQSIIAVEGVSAIVHAHDPKRLPSWLAQGPPGAWQNTPQSAPTHAQPMYILHMDLLAGYVEYSAKNPPIKAPMAERPAGRASVTRSQASLKHAVVEEDPTRRR